MRILAIVIGLLAASAAAHHRTEAAEINAFISTAIKAATDELLPPFERANGHAIRASYAPSGALIPRFERGEPVDVFLTDSAAIDEAWYFVQLSAAKEKPVLAHQLVHFVRERVPAHSVVRVIEVMIADGSIKERLDPKTGVKTYLPGPRKPTFG